VAGAQTHSGGHFHGLMASAADLEKDPVLALEGDFAIVQAAGGLHDAEGLDELVGIEAVPLGYSDWLSGGDGGQDNVPPTISVAELVQPEQR
jgi:hypothetical protein